MSKKESKVEVYMTSHGCGRVLIDGKELSQVFSLLFTTDAFGVNEITITLNPEVLEIHADPCQVLVK